MSETREFACRSCGKRDAGPVLSLGKIPLVNALVDPGDTHPDRLYPLDVVRCRTCLLVQITETVSPEELFRTYPYFSSYSDTFLEHARRFASRSIVEGGLGEQSLVVEAASNDGYLLQYFVREGIRSLGIEPAVNVAAAAAQRGIETVTEFLTAELASRIVSEHGEADLVVANNVLAHVSDPNDFVAALRILAGSRGRIVVEIPYLCDLVDGLQFDTIYHEHVSYFAVSSLAPLFATHGLHINRVERHSLHGGSLRIVASEAAETDPTVGRLVSEEALWGVGQQGRFDRFAAAVERLRREVHDFVCGLASAGETIVAYGAAAKGVVLANVCNLDTRLVEFVVDRNPHKQGKLLPGVRIPIKPPEALSRQQPAFCLLFAWNLADEITVQQSEYRERGGRFVVPLPTPRVLGT